jgi:cytochrome c553
MAFRHFLMTVLCVVFAAGLVWLGYSAFANETPDELIEKGREVFFTVAGVGCAECHGRYAEGDLGIGPFNRGANETNIRGALQKVDPMKIIRDEMTDEKIVQVAAYIRWLGELQLVKTLYKQGRFIPSEVSIYPGTAIQLAVNNASFEPHTFASDVMGIRPFRVNGRDFGDLTWRAPVNEGTFELRCSDCGSDGKLTIRVSRSAKPHVPSRPVLKSQATTSSSGGGG